MPCHAWGSVLIARAAEGATIGVSATFSRLAARALVLVAVCVPASCATALGAEFAPFGEPQQVSISGYSGSAMEPSITPDGQYLLFNTSNVAPSIPRLEFARRVDALTFTYGGEILGAGVNEEGALSGTPSTDREGNLYFVSTRSYFENLRGPLLRWRSHRDPSGSGRLGPKPGIRGL
jgi:hypothetical protein